MDSNITIEPERRVYHEAGHAVVAKLFEENIYMDRMTIATTTTSEGVIQFGSITILSKVEAWISVSIVSLAGMVTEMVWKDGPQNVVADKENILRKPGNYINKELGGVDFEKFLDDMAINSHKYAASEFEYQGLCLSFLIDFLCDERVWTTVEVLAKEVLKKENLTLDVNELEIIFVRTQYEAWKRDYKAKLDGHFKITTEKEKLLDNINNIINCNDADMLG